MNEPTEKETEPKIKLNLSFFYITKKRKVSKSKEEGGRKKREHTRSRLWSDAGSGESATHRQAFERIRKSNPVARS